MSVDLKLLVITGDPEDALCFAHTILELGSPGDLYPKLERIITQHGGTCHEGMTTYLARGEDAEHGYGRVPEDCYGKRIRYVRAKHLVHVSDNILRLYARSRAAWAYLRNIDAETAIGFYWH